MSRLDKAILGSKSNSLCASALSRVRRRFLPSTSRGSAKMSTRSIFSSSPYLQDSTPRAVQRVVTTPTHMVRKTHAARVVSRQDSLQKRLALYKRATSQIKDSFSAFFILTRVIQSLSNRQHEWRQNLAERPRADNSIIRIFAALDEVRVSQKHLP